MPYSRIIKTIILDRDGVINQDSADFIKSPEEWHAIPGSLEAIARLCQAGYQVVVITNQSGIARGLLTINTLNKIHQKMLAQLQELGGDISAIFFCPHGPDDACNCRKPLAGMFDELASRSNSELTGVYALGDSVRDLVAAHTAGATPILVTTGKGPVSMAAIANEPTTHWLHQVPQYPNLADFVSHLLDTEKQLTKASKVLR